jgi:hypothetical protein
MRKGTTAAAAKIIGGILVGVVELSSQNRGIVNPANAQAIGYDIWGVCLYALCLWLIISGVRFFIHTNQKQT